MTSISKSPVRWRGEGRALALKERGSPSEAFRKPVITDPTYIKRCRQPPATSHQPARSVSSISLFAFFSPSSLSSSSLCLYLYRPVRTSFFLSNLFILLWCTFTRSFFRFLFSFVFSFVLSVHFERPPASTPTAVHLIWPFPPIRIQRTLRFLFYFILLLYLLSVSFFPLQHFFFVSFFLSVSPAPFSSFSHLRLLCRQSRLATWNCPKNRLQQKERTSRKGEETMSNIFHSSSFLCFLFIFLFEFFFLAFVIFDFINTDITFIEIYPVFSVSFYTSYLFYKIFHIPLITFLTSMKINVCTNILLRSFFMQKHVYTF